jgi:hypothetical protein
MSAAQQPLALEGGEFYGSLPSGWLKPLPGIKIDGDVVRNEFQCVFPFRVAPIDTSASSRPIKMSSMANMQKCDRWDEPILELVDKYYAELTNYFFSQGRKYKPQDSYRLALESLFANFVKRRREGSWVGVSRDKSTPMQNGIGVKVLIHLTDWMAATGLIAHALGRQGANGAKGSGVVTVIRPAGQLQRQLRLVTVDCVGTRKTQPVLVLRERRKKGKRGKKIPMEEWSQRNGEKKPREAMRKLLEWLNQLWADVIVTLDGDPFEQCYFKASFTSSFLLGGRIYEGNIQNLPQNDRQRLLIDGQQVVEADYSGCQPRLMYGMEKLTFPEDDDPYRLPGFTREAVKAAAQPLMFGRSIKMAIASLKRSQNPKNKGKKDRNKEFVFKPELEDVDVVALAAAFRTKHAGIAHLFCTKDLALKLQRLDSKLMMDILNVTMADKVLAYPIHDSVIVTRQHKEYIVATMRHCFKEKYKFDCPVKVKG